MMTGPCVFACNTFLLPEMIVLVVLWKAWCLDWKCSGHRPALALVLVAGDGWISHQCHFLDTLIGCKKGKQKI